MSAIVGFLRGTARPHGAPFEAKDPAHRVVGAAREMLDTMEHINQHSSWPLRIGIGIHFGEVVAGNVARRAARNIPSLAIR